MDQVVMHNFIHSDFGNDAGACPVCNGEISSTDSAKMMEMVNTIMKRKQAQGYMYSTKDKKFKKTSGIIKASSKDDVVLRTSYQFGDDITELPKEIMLVPLGSWNTSKYGPVEVTKEDLDQMKLNFDANVRKGVMIDVDHGMSQYGDAAAGWIHSVEVRADGLWATEIDWTSLGDDLVKSKIYKFLSPEFDIVYVDPQDQNKVLDNVLIATSLVNRPLLKEIPALSFSEGKNLTDNKKGVMIFIDQEKIDHNGPTNNMNKEDILKKLAAGETLTADEKTFVSTNKTEFSEDQLKSAGIEEAPVTPVTPEAPATPPNDTSISAKEGNVTISASELASLKEMAEKGKLAFAEMERKQVAEELAQFKFSEKGGKFSVAAFDKAVSFANKLTPAQRVEFSEFLKTLPEKNIFGEAGSDEDVTAGKERDAIRAEVAQYAKDNNMKFGDAMRAMQQKDPKKFSEYKRSFEA